MEDHSTVKDGANNAKASGNQQAGISTPSASPIPLTLEQFRALVGIPQRSQTPPTHQIAPPAIYCHDIPATSPRALIILRLLSRPYFTRRSEKDLEAASEYATSLYFTILREESDQYRLYHAFDVITYACLILQIIIASTLIVLGAIPATNFSSHRIAIAVLGAFTGLLTGLLSLLKGQGLPNRPLIYAGRLAQLKQRIEFLERSLRANIGVIVTFEDVKELWSDFATAQKEQMMNRPDVWAVANDVGKGGSGFMKTAAEGESAFMNQLQNQRQVQIGQGIEIRNTSSTNPLPSGTQPSTQKPNPESSNLVAKAEKI